MKFPTCTVGQNSFFRLMVPFYRASHEYWILYIFNFHTLRVIGTCKFHFSLLNFWKFKNCRNFIKKFKTVSLNLKTFASISECLQICFKLNFVDNVCRHFRDIFLPIPNAYKSENVYECCKFLVFFVNSIFKQILNIFSRFQIIVNFKQEFKIFFSLLTDLIAN